MKQAQDEIIQVFNFLIMAPMATNDVDNNEDVEVEKNATFEMHEERINVFNHRWPSNNQLACLFNFHFKLY